MTNNSELEPAIEFKSMLSSQTYKLLNKLILDLKSRMPINERVYDKSDNQSLIYNLFNGGYQFSYKQYNELYKAIHSK